MLIHQICTLLYVEHLILGQVNNYIYIIVVLLGSSKHNVSWGNYSIIARQSLRAQFLFQNLCIVVIWYVHTLDTDTTSVYHQRWKLHPYIWIHTNNMAAQDNLLDSMEDTDLPESVMKSLLIQVWDFFIALFVSVL